MLLNNATEVDIFFDFSCPILLFPYRDITILKFLNNFQFQVI